MKQGISRFTIITGKGGVGKTTLSLAYCKYLQDIENKKVRVVYFQNSKISNEATSSFEHAEYQDYKDGDVNIEGINLKSCVQEYMARKLKSMTISKWIIKTPFFLSLVNMLPGFNYVIYLGQIIDELDDDPDLHIVLDAPSSGHVLTMLEATKNFSEIIQAGPVFNDTVKILDKLHSPSFMRIYIATLPTKLAFSEADELLTSLNNLGYQNNEVICNNGFQQLSKNKDIPFFLQEKIKNESELLAEHKEIELHLPFIPENDKAALVAKLSHQMDSLND